MFLLCKIGFSFITSRFNLKILLTGCEGLIGYALKTALLNKNVAVQGFDHKLPSVHQGYGDILELKDLEEAISGCDGVVHLAAISRVIWGERDPGLCWRTNFEGTMNVLKCASSSPRRPSIC
jgi:UDP-glucose 4-epimerase